MQYYNYVHTVHNVVNIVILYVHGAAGNSNEVIIGAVAGSVCIAIIIIIIMVITNIMIWIYCFRKSHDSGMYVE